MSSPSSPNSDPIGFFDSSTIGNEQKMSIGDKEMQIIQMSGSSNKLYTEDYKLIVAELIKKYSNEYEINDEYETKLDKIISHLQKVVAKGGKRRSKRRRNTKRQSKRQSKRR